MTENNLPVHASYEQVTNALAQDLAAKLTPVSELLVRYSLEAGQLKRIIATPEFKAKYAEAKALWENDNNASERTTSKATLLIEDSLLAVYGIVHDASVSPAARIQAFNSIVDLSEVAPKKQQAQAPGTGKQFSITINLPIGNSKIVIDEPLPIEHEAIEVLPND